MKKFGGLLNKLTGTSNGKLDGAARGDESSESSDEELQGDALYKKPFDVSQDHEDIKAKKAFSLRSLSPFKPQDAAPKNMDIDEAEYQKKKASSMRTLPGKDLDNEKLTESDDKAIRKSFSLRGMAIFKSTDQIKSDNPKSPSAIKAFFSPQHQSLSQHESDEENTDDEGAQSVPKNSRRVRVYSTADDSAPPTSFTVPYTNYTTSPSSNASSYSPIPTHSRISPVPAYTSANTHHPEVAQVPSATSRTPPPPVLPVEQFDAQFGNSRFRAESITDDYGSGYGSGYGRVRADSNANDDDDNADNTLIAQDDITPSNKFSFNPKTWKTR